MSNPARPSQNFTLYKDNTGAFSFTLVSGDNPIDIVNEYLTLRVVFYTRTGGIETGQFLFDYDLDDLTLTNTNTVSAVITKERVNELYGRGLCFVELVVTTATKTESLYVNQVQVFANIQGAEQSNASTLNVDGDFNVTLDITNVTIPPRYDFITPQQFGAIADGVTDDILAIQSAIDYAESVGSSNLVIFPKGIYRITERINVPSNFKIQFDSDAKLLVADNFDDTATPVQTDMTVGGLYYTAITPQGTSLARATNITLENVVVDGNSAGQVGQWNYAGILMSYVDDSLVIDCKSTDAMPDMYLTNNATRQFSIALTDCKNTSVIRGVYTDGGYESIAVRENCQDILVDGVYSANGGQHAGLQVVGTDGLTKRINITNNTFETSENRGSSGVILHTGIECKITNNTFIECVCFMFDGTERSIISGNHFYQSQSWIQPYMLISDSVTENPDKDIVWSDNVFTKSGDAVKNDVMRLTGVYGAKVSNNHVSLDDTDRVLINTVRGLRFNGDCGNILVDGNYFVNARIDQLDTANLEKISITNNYIDCYGSVGPHSINLHGASLNNINIENNTVFSVAGNRAISLDPSDAQANEGIIITGNSAISAAATGIKVDSNISGLIITNNRVGGNFGVLLDGTVDNAIVKNNDALKVPLSANAISVISSGSNIIVSDNLTV